MTQLEFNRALKAIEKEFKARAEEEAEIRLRWREEHGLIYVKTYTVQAHLRVRRPRRNNRSH